MGKKQTNEPLVADVEQFNDEQVVEKVPASNAEDLIPTKGNVKKTFANDLTEEAKAEFAENVKNVVIEILSKDELIVADIANVKMTMHSRTAKKIAGCQTVSEAFAILDSTERHAPKITTEKIVKSVATMTPEEKAELLALLQA